MTEEHIQPTHIAYADETHHNTGRYRGICLISLKIEDSEDLSEDLRRIIAGSSISEFKWTKLRTARERFAALKIIDYVIEKAIKQIIRVDVLTWDIEDSRHKIPGRSDVRNLRRMFYFLFKNVFSKRWSEDSVWRLCPDENTAVSWDSIAVYLSEIVDWNLGDLIAEINIESIIEANS